MMVLQWSICRAHDSFLVDKHGQTLNGGLMSQRSSPLHCRRSARSRKPTPPQAPFIARGPFRPLTRSLRNSEGEDPPRPCASHRCHCQGQGTSSVLRTRTSTVAGAAVTSKTGQREWAVFERVGAGWVSFWEWEDDGKLTYPRAPTISSEGG